MVKVVVIIVFVVIVVVVIVVVIVIGSCGGHQSASDPKEQSEPGLLAVFQHSTVD